MNSIEVTHLTKQFKNVVAVNDISFQIKQGEIVGFLGPNGAGKTTTMHMLLGIITPTSGDIHILGKDFAKHRGEILSQMNFSSAYIQFMSQLTIWENLFVFAKLYHVQNPKKKIAELLVMMEISDMKNKLFSKLSSGQKTRVVLAKTLLNDPRILLLDEPTASLDPDIADKVRTILRHIHKERGMTILYTSHNMAEIEELCERVIFLHKGTIIHQGTPQELMKIIPHYAIEIVLENHSNAMETFKKSFNEKNIKELSPGHFVITTEHTQLTSALHVIMASGLTIKDIDIHKPDLEDVFIKFSREEKQS